MERAIRPCRPQFFGQYYHLYARRSVVFKIMAPIFILLLLSTLSLRLTARGLTLPKLNIYSKLSISLGFMAID